MPEISIIMPLYNAEKYLQETLDSVLKQTFADYELICINDASTDMTQEIVNSYIEKDSRIKLIQNEERLGAGESRNRGMREARGKYFSFLDGDDIFEEEMLEAAYKACESYHTDLVCYQGKSVSSDNIYEKDFVELDSYYLKKYCSKPFEMLDISPYCALVNGAPWMQLFRAGFILENRLEYQSLPSCNDMYFVLMAFFLAKKIVVLNDMRVMVYQRAHQEVSRISYYRDPMCVYYAMKKIQDELVKRNLFSKYYQYFYYYCLRGILVNIVNCKNISEAKAFYNYMQKEGLSRIVEADRESFENADIYIRYIIKQFENEFETEWWKNIHSQMDILLINKREELIALYNRCKKENKKIALWGAGNYGNKIIDFCNRNHLRLDAIVDKSKKVQGESKGGYIVKSPEELENNISIIIASNRRIYDENNEKFRRGKVKFWEMGEYFD